MAMRPQTQLEKSLASYPLNGKIKLVLAQFIFFLGWGVLLDSNHLRTALTMIGIGFLLQIWGFTQHMLAVID